MVCETCKGKGVIELFTSTVACDACGGSGEKLVGTFTISQGSKAIGGVYQNKITTDGIDAVMDLRDFLNRKLGEPFPALEVLCVTDDPDPWCHPDMPESYRINKGPGPPLRALLITSETFIDYFQQFNQFRWTVRDYHCDRRYFTLKGLAASDYLYHNLTISPLSSCDAALEAIEKVINAKIE